MAEAVSTAWEPTQAGGRGRARRWLLIAGLLLVGLLVGSVAAVAWATYSYGRELDGRILPGVTVAGVDVSAMTREEALQAVRSAVAPRLDRPVSLRWDERSWTATPRELGAAEDAEAAVDAALSASERVDWTGLAKMRWLDHTLGFHRDVMVTNDSQQVRAFIDAIASELNVAPRNAALNYATGWVTITPEQVGRVMDTEAAHVAFLHGLNGGPDDVDVVMHPVPAQVTAASFDQVLLLRQREHKLYLYQNGQITHSWLVAVGTGGYPTPTGVYRITQKRNMPTWINPDPTGWGAGMPARIGPGPGNPLGLRALNWNASGIRFHGTQNVGSLGRDASHGCVRLSNPDVIQLYDLVAVDTPIVSINSA
ncbi:MAG TPA: L,D-transpeptidase/peptidoglycan binding protein [Egibacteraceae bacterium]|nr:L,D-transpeptidase/peptidoglycan binding protein [Actinomycetota bacterium]HWB72760.1 L,D-transpeptidase/peptidoglycan binding protein [Egibacteraceae bacterium]